MEFQQNEEPNDREPNHRRSRIRRSENISKQRQRTQPTQQAVKEPEGIESEFVLIAT